MNKQIRISVTALALSAALVSLPALAQKAGNDGGPVAEPGGSVAQRPSSQVSVAQQSGKPANDGGSTQEPAQQAQQPASTSRKLYNSAGPQQTAPAQTKAIGKPSNDGGPM